MIIKASQRGGANKLAAHLLNEQDNEHVEVHRIKGFISSNLRGALNEAYAISRGTQCKQFLFSVSLSPPPEEDVPISVFEDAASRIEKVMKLKGQSHVIVFHEKEGRRHAHVIWNRINAEDMKAINLPFFKNKMMEISRELYLDYGWNMPKGFIDRELKNPLSFTHDEWQQAKRLNQEPRLMKAAIQDSWTQSKTKKEFVETLEKRGFYLAGGDRRGYVVLDWRGEVYSLTRMAGVKKKELKAKLGEETELASVEQTRNDIDQQLTSRVIELTQTIHHRYEQMLSPMLAKRERLKQQHNSERQALRAKQQEQKQALAQQQQARYKKGLLGIWERIIRKHGKIRKQNEVESQAFIKLVKEEREKLIFAQLKSRRHLQTVINNYRLHRDKELESMKEAVFSKLPEEHFRKYQKVFDRAAQGRGFEPEI